VHGYIELLYAVVDSEATATSFYTVNIRQLIKWSLWRLLEELSQDCNRYLYSCAV